MRTFQDIERFSASRGDSNPRDKSAKSGTLESVNPGYFTSFFCFCLNILHPSLTSKKKTRETNYQYNFSWFRHIKRKRGS